MGTEEIQLVIVISTLVILLMAAGLVVFFIFIQKRKTRYLQDKQRIREELEKTYLKSQMEIQENTLQYIGMELHDNLGQILSSVKLKLSMVLTDGGAQGQLQEVHDIIAKSIGEVRALSRTLNRDQIKNFGLIEAIEIELKRYRRWEIIQTHFEYQGKIELDYHKDHLILFRILQEFFSNTIRHAEAKNLWVQIIHKENLYIRAHDDGVGMGDDQNVNKGTGLLNMHYRASMIKADIEVLSSPGEGTVLTLLYPHE